MSQKTKQELGLKFTEYRFLIRILLLKQKSHPRVLCRDKLQQMYGRLEVPSTLRSFRRHCPFTKRARGNSQFLGVSRFLAKRNIEHGNFPGLVGASW